MLATPYFSGLHTSSNIVKNNGKIKIYPDGSCKVTLFDSPRFISDGWEEEKKLGNFKPTELDWEEITERPDNTKRAKDKVFDIALLNNWDYMVTFTLDGAKIDRFDPNRVIKPFMDWLKNTVKRKGLKYLIVPELHQDGAIHFHGLCNADGLDLADSGTVKVMGYKKPIKNSTADKYKIKVEDRKTIYNVKNYKLGYSTAIKIDGNPQAVSKYMTKYITKDFHKIFGKSYFAGGKIEREVPCRYFNLAFEEFKAEAIKLPKNFGAVKYWAGNYAQLAERIEELEQQVNADNLQLDILSSRTA